jgi:hypothetical protein
MIDANGLMGPERPPFPTGASLFADSNEAPLTGHYHRLPAGTVLPAGLDVVADGIDVHLNSPHARTHHTLFPTGKVSERKFISDFLSLPWQYAGRKA